MAAGKQLPLPRLPGVCERGMHDSMQPPKQRVDCSRLVARRKAPQVKRYAPLRKRRELSARLVQGKQILREVAWARNKAPDGFVLHSSAETRQTED